MLVSYLKCYQTIVILTQLTVNGYSISRRMWSNIKFMHAVRCGALDNYYFLTVWYFPR